MIFASILAASLVHSQGSFLRVTVDRQDESDNLQIEEDPTGYDVPLTRAMASFFPYIDGITYEAKGGKEVTISWKGRKWVVLPLGSQDDKSTGTARVFDPPGSKNPYLVPNLARVPYIRKGEVIADIETLAPLMGSSLDFDKSSLAVTTLDEWTVRALRGADIAPKRILEAPQHLSLVPEVGITPFSEAAGGRLAVSTWIRPRRNCYFQLYSLNASALWDPIMRVDSAGNVDLQADEARSVALKADELRRWQRTITGFNGSGAVSYLYVVHTGDIGAADAMESLKTSAGRKALGDWLVVGLENSVHPANPLVYRNPRPAEKVSAETFAAKNGMSPKLFCMLNGCRPQEILSQKETYTVIEPETRPWEAREVDFKILGLYVVKSTDTLASLAKSWGVSEAEIQLVNQMSGRELEPYSIISRIAKVASPLQPNLTAGFNDQEPVSLKVVAAVNLYDNPNFLKANKIASIPAGTPVVVLAQGVEDDRAKVQFGNLLGYIPQNRLEGLKPPQATALQASKSSYLPGSPSSTWTADDQAAYRSGAAAVLYGMKFQGVPYSFGGKSLTTGPGIDCSHFVYECYAGVGQYCPPPNVENQMNYGQVSYMNPRALRYPRRGGDRVLNPRLGNPGLMLPGDRMVLWKNKGYPWHTALYMGHLYRGKKLPIIEAVGGRGGSVKITSATRYIDRGWFSYALRGPTKPAPRRPR